MEKRFIEGRKMRQGERDKKRKSEVRKERKSR